MIKSLFNIPNMLSLLRAPLVLFFFSDNTFYRCLAVVCAMVTDCLDGYLARRWGRPTQLGAMLDPMTDKFFVVFVLAVFFIEDRLTLLQIACLLGRDFAVFAFGIYLYVSRLWARYEFRAIWSGKVTTALQFIALIALLLGYALPSALFGLFALLGGLALIELFAMARRRLAV